MSWKEVFLGDIITTQKGYAFKSKWFQKTGVPVVKVKDFTTNSIDSSDLAYVSKSLADNYLKYSLNSLDIIVQTVGSWASNPDSVVGKVIAVPQNLEGALLNQNAVKLEPIESVNSRFLYYRLKDDSFKYYLIGTAQGAANQASITLESIRRFDFNIPPLTTQNRIASILSAYDDLIENNLNRSKLLEEAAINIYREWFVHFRFPGHEDVKMVEDEKGRKLPEGWEYISIGDFANINANSVTKSSPPDYIKYIDISSTQTGLYDKPHKLPFKEAPSRAKRIVKHGDSIFSTVRPNRKTYALIINPKEYLVCSTGFAVISPKENFHTAFLYATISSDEFVNNAVNVAGGAAYPAIKQSDFKSLKILIPSNGYIKMYSKVCMKMMLQKAKLISTNEALKEARDVLLPRLMNQTIKV